MGAIEVQHYVQRAQGFFDGMSRLREENGPRNSAALLGIHCAISYSDALRSGFGAMGLSSDDHNTAVTSLPQFLRPDQSEGLKHLKLLLAKKSAIAYGSRRIPDEDYEDVFTRTERFTRWANRIGSEMKLGGWSDANG